MIVNFTSHFRSCAAPVYLILGILLFTPTAYAQDCGRINQSFELYFQSQSTELVPTASAVVDQAIENVNNAWANVGVESCKLEPIAITGHTDRFGSVERNEALSLAMAHTVSDYFIEEYGSRKEVFIVMGNGESEPSKPTKDGVKEPENRRVTVDITFVAK